MGLGIVDDGLPTEDHPEIEGFLVKAREAAVGQKITALGHGRLRRPGGGGSLGSAFQVTLDNGQVLVFFSPVAYGLGQPRIQV